MLFVVSKEKIISYIIAFSTVLILLGISILSIQKQEAIETVGPVNNTNNVQYQE